VRIKGLILFLTIASSLFAQGNTKLVLNLEQAIVTALENNHDLKKAKLDFEKAEQQVREAYGTSLFPAIDGSVQYNRALKRPEFFIETPFFTGRFPSGTKNTLTSVVTAEQPLFTGAMFLAVNIAETFAEISKKTEQFSEADLIKQVKQAYYTCLLSERLIELAELQLERAEENMNEAKSMFDAGLVSEYDYIKAKVQYKNMLPTLTEAQIQKRLALNNLKILLGTELETEVVITDSLVYSKKSLPEYEIGLTNVLQRNKLLNQVELQTELQDLNASYQFTQHLPKLNAFANWQVQAQENDDRAFSDWRYINSVTVGVTLSVPIFRGWELDSKAEQAKIDYKKSLEDFLKTKKAVKNEYENSLLTIQKIEQQVNAYNDAVQEAQRGYEIASKRFETGLGSQIEVTNALVDFSQAKINYLQAVHDYYVEQANLDLLLGKSVDEILNQN
jgi:outer membrane protein TolC